jgi:hypothetical protein
MTDANGVQVIAQWRPRVRGELKDLCTPVAGRAADVDIGFFEEAFGSLVGNKGIANGMGGGGEELVHVR